MDLAAIETALTAWVTKYSGLPCEWGRQSQKMHAGPYVLAYLGAITKAGHDERIQTYDFDTDSTAVTVVGVRRLTLRLSFRSFSQALGSSGRAYAETFRVAMHAQSSWDELNAALLAFIDSGELVDSDYEWSGRRVSQCDMDVVFGLRAYAVDPNHDGSYIKYVNIDTQEYVVDEDDVPVVDVSGDFVTVDTD